MPDRPEIVCICGSTRLVDEMARANRDLTFAGAIVLAPGVFGRVDGTDAQTRITPAQKAALDALHLRKIDLADRVLVVNPGGYIGESTRNEIAYARATGTPVDFTHAPVTGDIGIHPRRLEDADEIADFLRAADLTLSGLDDPNVRLWIDRDAYGVMIGTTGYELSADGAHALLRSVAVASAHRARGRGSDLARFALDRAIGEGATTAWLFSRRSGPFWQSLGFARARPLNPARGAHRRSVDASGANSATDPAERDH